MKKITFLLFFAFLSSSSLFAQTKELTKPVDSQALQVNKNTAPLEMLKVQDSEMPMLELSEGSQAKEDLAMKNRLRENEAKSKVSKEERDNLSDAIAKRLEESKKHTASLTKRNIDLEKQRIALEKRRKVAREKAMQNYVVLSSKEVAGKKSNQQNK